MYKSVALCYNIINKRNKPKSQREVKRNEKDEY
nr:MAG TPA: hypothetical protein [Caudoviricetes sp.]